MSRYDVTIHELVSYTITVEAEDEDEAADLAEDKLLADPNPKPDEVIEREAVRVHQIKENE